MTISKAKKKASKTVVGYETSTTGKDYRVVRIHYTADPEKRSADWREKTKREMPDLMSWQREFEIDWSATTGLPFYPEFVRGYAADKGTFVRKLSILAKQPVIRGWDFGRRKPACVWFQVSPTGRVGVLREFCPQSIDSYNFRDAVRYLSGQLAWDDPDFQRRDRARYWIEKLKHQVDIGQLPPMPWFEPGTEFFDYSGHEATIYKSIEGEKGELNDQEILASGGVELVSLPQRVTAGEYIIRRLCAPHPDGNGASLLLSQFCPVLVGGLAGGITYKKGTKINPLEDAAAKDGHFEHPHDALRYGLVGATPLLEDFPVAKTKSTAPRCDHDELGHHDDEEGISHIASEYE
jgi:hypothetical protein